MSMTFSAEDLENLDTGGGLPKPGEGSDAAAAAAAAKPATPTEFRYGNDVPEELRGKTPEEAVALYTAAKQVASTAFESLRRTVPQAPAAPAEVPRLPELTAEDLTGLDPAVVNQKIQQLFEAKATPVVNEMLENQARTTHMLLRTHPNLPYFQKYEQEILAAMAQVPPAHRAKPETWQFVYNNVQSMHLNEILADQKANWERERSAPPQFERGRGGPQIATKPVLSDEQRAIYASMGVSEEEALKYMPKEV